MSRNGQKTSAGDIILAIILLPFAVFVWAWNKLIDAIFN